VDGKPFGRARRLAAGFLIPNWNRLVLAHPTLDLLDFEFDHLCTMAVGITEQDMIQAAVLQGGTPYDALQHVQKMLEEPDEEPAAVEGDTPAVAGEVMETPVAATSVTDDEENAKMFLSFMQNGPDQHG